MPNQRMCVGTRIAGERVELTPGTPEKRTETVEFLL